ncbi:hypothetical protein DL95DRAFT_101750 [Leptodontidium sp. 2 PMI_412]|nr:hypothetical protein DL95DRAFT_101750 [Leptodontidium sp. 2 PMI_412]
MFSVLFPFLWLVLVLVHTSLTERVGWRDDLSVHAFSIPMFLYPLLLLLSCVHQSYVWVDGEEPGERCHGIIHDGDPCLERQEYRERETVLGVLEIMGARVCVKEKCR